MAGGLVVVGAFLLMRAGMYTADGTWPWTMAVPVEAFGIGAVALGGAYILRRL
jgi:hypothetical protein